jgi:hypothetical protein
MSPNHKILLIAEPDDPETRLVADALVHHAVKARWIDTADFPSHLGLVATPGASHPGRLLSRTVRLIFLWCIVFIAAAQPYSGWQTTRLPPSDGLR